MKKTLKELMDEYPVRFITMRCGHHIIQIDTEGEGSNFIIRAFKNEYFYFVEIDEEAQKLYISSTPEE